MIKRWKLQWWKLYLFLQKTRKSNKEIKRKLLKKTNKLNMKICQLFQLLQVSQLKTWEKINYTLTGRLYFIYFCVEVLNTTFQTENYRRIMLSDVQKLLKLCIKSFFMHILEITFGCTIIFLYEILILLQCCLFFQTIKISKG